MLVHIPNMIPPALRVEPLCRSWPSGRICVGMWVHRYRCVGWDSKSPHTNLQVRSVQDASVRPCPTHVLDTCWIHVSGAHRHLRRLYKWSASGVLPALITVWCSRGSIFASSPGGPEASRKAETMQWYRTLLLHFFKVLYWKSKNAFFVFVFVF